MSEKHTLDLSAIRGDNIDRVVSFIPRLDVLIPSAIADWGDVGNRDAGEKIVLRLAPDYHPVVQELIHALYENNFVQSFDWGAWSGEAQRLHSNPDLLSHADLDTLVKLLTLHVRRDRFVGGHFGEMVRSGHISAILRRLQALREIGAN